MNSDPGNALGVYLHGQRIGLINRLAGERQLFAFNEAYVDNPERSTLSLSFKGRGGGLVTRPQTASVKVPPFFSNLLPEGPLRSYLARQAGVKPQREFFLLAALGQDLPGAVIVKPLSDADDDADHGDAAAADHDHPPEDAALRFSLAGVQLKFSAIVEASGGLTIPADGMGGSWIVKLPSTQYPAVPENEFAMLELARAAGIAVPDFRLVPVEEIKGLPRDAARLEGCALAIQRFDRVPDGSRIHMEDFAQVFGVFPEEKYGKRSYANIAEVLWAETGAEDTWEFVRRIAFSVLIGNGDMHLKNWSLLYPDGRTPELSPAYDLVSTTPYIPDDQLGLKLGDSKSLTGITRDQIRRFSDKARLPVSAAWEIVEDTAARVLDAWNRLDARDVLPAKLRDQISQQIEKAARGIET